MKRIASLSILFAALIEFAVERAKFDLWILIIAIVQKQMSSTWTHLRHPDAEINQLRMSLAWCSIGVNSRGRGGVTYARNGF
jgi:hypothetical protein